MLTLLLVATLSQPVEPPPRPASKNPTGAHWAIGVASGLGGGALIAGMGTLLGAAQGYFSMLVGAMVGGFIGALLSPVIMLAIAMALGADAARHRPPVTPLITLRSDRNGTGLQVGFATRF